MEEKIKTIDFRGKLLKKYLKQKSDYGVYWTLYFGHQQFQDCQFLNIKWKDDGSVKYKVYFSLKKDYSDASVFEVISNQINEGVTVPGKTYFYKVENDKGVLIKEGSFKVKENIIRPLNIKGVCNVRDLGGYKTDTKKRVKYELLYRGGGIDCLSFVSCGRDVFLNNLKIKTDIDLRGEYENNEEEGNVLKKYGMKYVYAGILPYEYIFPQFKQELPIKREFCKETIPSLRKIFEIISNIDNYPIYFHCAVGADRTGTLAFLLNGLLGVSKEDLIKDYEITTFSSSGYRCRGAWGEKEQKFISGVQSEDYCAFGNMIDEMFEYYGTKDKKLSSAIENYLINAIGIKKEQIDNFKKIMLL